MMEFDNLKIQKNMFLSTKNNDKTEIFRAIFREKISREAQELLEKGKISLHGAASWETSL